MYSLKPCLRKWKHRSHTERRYLAYIYICNWENLHIQSMYKLQILEKEKVSNREDMDKTLEKTFHKIGQFHTANKYLKRLTLLLIIREMWIKTKVSFFIYTKMANIKWSVNYKNWRRCRVKGNLRHCWLECKLV